MLTVGFSILLLSISYCWLQSCMWPFSVISTDSYSATSPINVQRGIALQGNHSPENVNSKCVINADQGDPVMFESYWLQNAGDLRTVILAHELLSYISNSDGVCWFMEPELENQIRTVHRLVGNALTDGRYIVVGTGSSQLFTVALYALSASNSEITDVVSAAPYYSLYPILADYLRSGIYRWAGEGGRLDEEAPYIELITSPNNPDGKIRSAVLNQSRGSQIYDLAYYWPHFTPITAPADEDIMLFTMSKSTGHAGTRIGWAIVKDLEVAKRMTKVIGLTTIGVSRDSQLRASQILKHINIAYSRRGNPPYKLEALVHERMQSKYMFHYAYSVMEYRWARLREALAGGNRFSLPELQPELCSFFGQETSPHPAFAWLQCDIEQDCQQVLEGEGIQSRGGAHFGVDPKYVRVSMMQTNDRFEILADRLATMKYV